METLLKELSNLNLSGWMIFILLFISIIFYFFKKPLSELIKKVSFKKETKENKIKDLINHDLFNTLARVKLEVKNMKFYTHGKYDANKTRMCYDFTRFKSDVCYKRFQEFLDRDLDSISLDALKREMLTEMGIMHEEYVNETSNFWLQKGITKEDVDYIIELFERFRFDVVQSFVNRIEAIFSTSYHPTNFDKILACYDMFAMGVDLLPKDMQTTFEALNGRFTNISYK